MNVLWVCNVRPSYVNCSQNCIDNGGWMSGILGKLNQNKDIKIYVVYPDKQQKDCECVQDIQVQALKSSGKTTCYDSCFHDAISRLIEVQKFDCIHIWGTEYPHTLATIDAASKQNLLNKTIIWIQGLCSIYAKHYYGYLPERLVHGFTLKEMLKRSNLVRQKKIFEIRGEFEKQALRKCKHVCGRTDWDYITTKLINPELKYHKCNESLRSSFYHANWNLNNCVKGRIFASQASYPIKGFHILLKAVRILHEYHPGVELYVGGEDITFDHSNKKWRLGSYGKYLKQYIEKYNMKSYVHFLGNLTEKQMVEQYLLANVFVLPSSIENSPNSLGEAMIIGTPCIASDVGGVKDMLIHRSEGLIYPADEEYMLAGYLMELLENDALALKYSTAGKSRATKTHDVETNVSCLLKIYNEVGGDIC